MESGQFKNLIINQLSNNQKVESMKKVKNLFLRKVYIVLGSISLALGILGIFLPLLPTTVFLLITAYFYGKSSARFYNWLLNNKYIGGYIKTYREERGMPLKAKIFAISLLWLTIGSTVIFFLDILLIKILLLAIATGVSIYLLSLKTIPLKN